jgi:ankyrin repeat protein
MEPHTFLDPSDPSDPVTSSEPVSITEILFVAALTGYVDECANTVDLCSATRTDERLLEAVARARHGPHLRSRLSFAALRGDADAVRAWMARGSSPWTPGRTGWTAFSWAAKGGHAEILSMMLAACPTPQSRPRVSPRGSTQAMTATGAGSGAGAGTGSGSTAGPGSATSLSVGAGADAAPVISPVALHDRGILEGVARSAPSPFLFAFAEGHDDAAAAALRLGLYAPADVSETMLTNAVTTRMERTALALLSRFNLTKEATSTFQRTGRLQATPTLRASLLLAAAAADSPALLAALIAAGVSVDEAVHGERAIHAAADTGSCRAIAFLLDAGTDIENKRVGKDTPLMYACRRGQPEAAMLLLDRGANPSASTTVHMPDDRDLAGEGAAAETGPGHNALIYAALSGLDAVVRRLIATGRVDVNAVTEQGSTALSLSCWKGNEAAARAIVEASRAKGLPLDVNSLNTDGNTPLHLACWARCPSTAHLLIDHGADFTARNAKGSTPLTLAAWRGLGTVVERLVVEKGQPVDTRNSNGNTAFLLACLDGRVDVARRLAELGADVNATNENKENALRIAAQKGRVEVALLLASIGANLEVPNRDGNTALTLACWASQTRIALRLIEAGASINHVNAKGSTAFTLAAWRGLTEVVEKLAEMGADINHQNLKGNSALHLAAYERHEDLALRLVALGARHDLFNVAGSDALAVAERNTLPRLAERIRASLETAADTEEWTGEEASGGPAPAAGMGSGTGTGAGMGAGTGTGAGEQEDGSRGVDQDQDQTRGAEGTGRDDEEEEN